MISHIKAAVAAAALVTFSVLAAMSIPTEARAADCNATVGTPSPDLTICFNIGYVTVTSSSASGWVDAVVSSDTAAAFRYTWLDSNGNVIATEGGIDMDAACVGGEATGPELRVEGLATRSGPVFATASAFPVVVCATPIATPSPTPAPAPLSVEAELTYFANSNPDVAFANLDVDLGEYLAQNGVATWTVPGLGSFEGRFGTQVEIPCSLLPATATVLFADGGASATDTVDIPFECLTASLELVDYQQDGAFMNAWFAGSVTAGTGNPPSIRLNFEGTGTTTFGPVDSVTGSTFSSFASIECWKLYRDDYPIPAVLDVTEASAVAGTLQASAMVQMPECEVDPLAAEAHLIAAEESAGEMTVSLAATAFGGYPDYTFEWEVPTREGVLGATFDASVPCSALLDGRAVVTATDMVGQAVTREVPLPTCADAPPPAAPQSPEPPASPAGASTPTRGSAPVTNLPNTAIDPPMSRPTGPLALVVAVAIAAGAVAVSIRTCRVRPRRAPSGYFPARGGAEDVRRG